MLCDVSVHPYWGQKDNKAGEGRILLFSVWLVESCLEHCSLTRLIVLTPLLVAPFISRGAAHQTARETSNSKRRIYGREMASQI
jgi:hypothetical protein